MKLYTAVTHSCLIFLYFVTKITVRGSYIDRNDRVNELYCPELNYPENIRSLACTNSTYYGSVCTISCKDGYAVRGSRCRRCQSNGAWSGYATSCQPIHGCFPARTEKHEKSLHPSFVRKACCPAGKDGTKYSPETHDCCFAGKLRWIMPKLEDSSYDCGCCQEHKSECWTCCDEVVPEHNEDVSSLKKTFKDDGIELSTSFNETYTQEEPMINFKVIGGGPASFEARRRNAYLIYKRDLWGNIPIHGFPPICGGVLIHASWVLTARHCITKSMCEEKILKSSPLRVIIGKKNTSILAENDGQERDVSIAICHHHYCNNRNKPDLNDIALIKLSSPIDMTDPNVALASLPPQSDVVSPWTTCLLTGWGIERKIGIFPLPDYERWVNEYIDATPATLKEVSVPVVPNPYCRGRIRPCHICAGMFRKDGCSSDSGSPLFCDDRESPSGRFSNIRGVKKFHSSNVSTGNKFVVQGIFNSGLCGSRANVPGVYARVSFYRDWIDDNIDFYSTK